MTEDNLPFATHQKTFRMFGIDVRCYVLNDGRRIINADDTKKLFALLGDLPDDPNGTATYAEIRKVLSGNDGVPDGFAPLPETAGTPQ